MAVYVPMRCVQRNSLHIAYEFSCSIGAEYVVLGVVAIDLINKEIILIEEYHKRAQHMLPLARNVLQRCLTENNFPDKTAYAA